MEYKKSSKEKEVFSYVNSKGTLWMYRYKYYDDLTGKRKEKKKSGFKTEKEAIKALYEVKSLMLRGETKSIENDNMTVSEWLDIWLELNKDTWKITTMKQRNLAVNNHMKRLIGHFKIQKLDRLTYQRAFINELEKTLSPSTVLLYHSIFKAAINSAIDEEILTRNRFRKIRIQDNTKGINSDITKETNNFITIEELNKVLATVKRNEADPFYTFLLLCVFTGIRRGEGFGLKHKNLNFVDNTIQIECTRDQFGARTPKTMNSYRTIKVEPFVMEELKKYKTWCKEILLRSGQKLSDDDYVFIVESGNLLHGSYVHSRFRDALLRTGIVNGKGEPKITFHGLRHTHATILLNNGVNPKVIAERLGNTTAMIYEIYGHVMKELEQHSVDIFTKSIETGIALGANDGAK